MTKRRGGNPRRIAKRRELDRYLFRPRGEWLEDRRLLASIHWDGGAAPNRDWFAAANWVGNVLPGVEDVAVIDFPGTYTVTLSANPTVAGLLLGGSGSQPT
jgi:hypothetical protein